MKGEPQRDPVLVQALSLYLLLLAFFVALYNISRTEEPKAKAVTASVQATFAEGVLAPIDIGQSPVEIGRVHTPVEFLNQLGRVVQTNLPLALFDIVRPDRSLEIRVPLAALFVDGTARLRREAAGLADRLAAAVHEMPAGVFVDVDVVHPVRGTVELQHGERAPIELARSAILAGLLSERGGLRGSTAAAVAVAEPGLMRILFHLRYDGEASPPLPAAPSRAANP